MTNNPKRKLKDSVAAIPGVGYTARVVSNVAKLPKSHKEILERFDKINGQLESLGAQNERDTAAANKKTDDLNDKLAEVESTLDNIAQQLSELKSGKSAAPTTASKQELFADDHLMDKFYTGLEDRFRGAEKMIMDRQEEYLPYFLNSKLDFKKTPVLDIGSGRGEFLQLLKNKNIKAIGLDINLDMVERSKQKGLDAVQGDALDFLQDKSSNTYGAITGYHIVEHIPFNILLRIFRNAQRTLAKDGFVIFETPNPENVIVGTHNFYMDPSHLHPLPPVLLAFALETCGFRNVEIKRLHPDEDKHNTSGLPADIVERFYGPRDYAVIGYK